MKNKYDWKELVNNLRSAVTAVYVGAVRFFEPLTKAKRDEKEDIFEAVAQEGAGGMALRVQTGATSASLRALTRIQLAVAIAAYRHINQLGGVKLEPKKLKDDAYEVIIRHDKDDEVWAQMLGAIMRQRDVLLAEWRPTGDEDKTPQTWLKLARREMVRSQHIQVIDQNSAAEFMSCVLNATTYLAICLERHGVVEPLDLS